MAIIKSGASSDNLTIDATSKALRATLYASDGAYMGEKATYRASTIIPLVAAVTVNVPFFNIIGSASKTVTIKRIRVSGMTLTAVGYFTINVVRYSSASTGGTSTVLVNTQMDTNNSAVKNSNGISSFFILFILLCIQCQQPKFLHSPTQPGKSMQPPEQHPAKLTPPFLAYHQN